MATTPAISGSGCKYPKTLSGTIKAMTPFVIMLASRKKHTSDASWLCGVSDLMSNLSKYTVIMHALPAYLNHSRPVLTYACPDRLHLSFNGKDFPQAFPSAAQGDYPIITITRFEWTAGYQAWRSLSHFPQTNAFMPPGTLISQAPINV